MRGESLFSVVFFLLIVTSATLAGCSDDSSSAEKTTPTPAHPVAKYQEGDIIATPSSAGASSLYVILKYDAAADQYTRAVIEKNADGSWGYRSSDRTEKISRAALEKIYTVRAGHVVISILPVITPTILMDSVQNPSGKPPSISKITPTSAVRDSVVSVTIAGSGFQNGATVRLFKAGSLPINATVTSVTAFDITCHFNLNGKSAGSYNLIVLNPDGQSDSRQAIFTVGEAAPVIAGMYPVTGALGHSIPLTISGQNFRTEVKVSFLKDSTELVCDNPLSMESSKITCTLDLSKNRGASAGEWNVTVINIRDGQRGSWLKKFMVTNATLEGD
jgi:hypothetical protein